MIDHGLWNLWTPAHLGAGVVLASYYNSDAREQRTGKRLNSFQVLGKVAMWALAWEAGEFAIEGQFSPARYQKIYGGRAVEDTAMDIGIALLGAAIVVHEELWWDTKLLIKGEL